VAQVSFARSLTRLCVPGKSCYLTHAVGIWATHSDWWLFMRQIDLWRCFIREISSMHSHEHTLKWSFIWNVRNILSCRSIKSAREKQGKSRKILRSFFVIVLLDLRLKSREEVAISLNNIQSHIHHDFCKHVSFDLRDSSDFVSVTWDMYKMNILTPD